MEYTWKCPKKCKWPWRNLYNTRTWLACTHCTPSILEEPNISKHNFFRVNTEIHNTERSVFSKNKIAQLLWIFQSGVNSGMNVLLFEIKLIQ